MDARSGVTWADLRSVCSQVHDRQRTCKHSTGLCRELPRQVQPMHEPNCHTSCAPHASHEDELRRGPACAPQARHESALRRRTADLDERTTITQREACQVDAPSRHPRCWPLGGRTPCRKTCGWGREGPRRHKVATVAPSPLRTKQP